MPYRDTQEQAALREAIRDLLRRAGGGPAEALPDGSLWRRLAGELGLTGLAVPAKYGGAGATLAEVAVAVEETGRVLLPLPYLSTALAGAVLDRDPAASEFLPGIADGTIRAAFALTGSVAVTGSRVADSRVAGGRVAGGRVAGSRVAGTAGHVLDGAEADLFLVAAGGGLYAVRAGDAVVVAADPLDQSRSQATVSFRDSPALLASSAGPDHAEDLLRTLLAAECAAAAAQCLEVTVSYLKTRVQFGRPLGAFQALRHRCADLAVAVASAQATAHAAVAVAGAAAGGGGTVPLTVLAPLAKKHCADVFWQVACEMVQLHGGIGCTWEHQAHRYLKRAKTTQLMLGTPSELRRLVAQRAGLRG